MFHISETLTLQKFREISRKIEIFRETSYSLVHRNCQRGSESLERAPRPTTPTTLPGDAGRAGAQGGTSYGYG